MFIKFVTSRFFQFVILPLFIIGWFVYTDPSGGADTLLRVQLWVQAFLVTGLAYLVAKALLGKASSEDLYAESIKGNAAAGHAYLGVCLMRAVVLVGLLIFFAMQQG
jgi:hypothetical protein